ncbi:neural proliferation differentiation and control protein 1 isoform X2 [Nannospalax galili]|uniref:neural proliferation differentiation and control protein 1 isoform X2 n=1 Tax=Nannospalax galili TaxID=1026970 RepID=UPI0004ED312B|nr:neural proliferation differentiation and control protein 1 isoform X2 [Nannospalax galili]
MATPVPPPSSRHLRLLRLLLSGLILGAALNRATASRPDAATCPGSLDCALKRRAKCPPGAHACGPCLQPFQEDQQGLCVPRMHRSPVSGQPALPPRSLSLCTPHSMFGSISPVLVAAISLDVPSGEGLPQPRLEEEIDFLAQELALKENEAGHSRLTARPLPETRQKLLEPATLGVSEWGQALEPGLPSMRGASPPTPRASLGSPVSSGPVHMAPLEPRGGRGNGLTLVLILAFCMAGTAALAVAALCWCRLQREIRLTQKADYTTAKAPTLPTTPRISPGDQRLAHSAEMYHYQHQRQQMLCLERHKEPPKELESASSDEENEDGDFTVYECPGLAPTGEMEVRNPLFDHSSLSAPMPGPGSSPLMQ